MLPQRSPSQYFRFAARGATLEPRRSTFLEQLLARSQHCATLSDWRADAFRIIAPQAACVPAVAAAALCADRGAVDGAWVCLASPVLYVAETSNVRLSAEGILTLAPADAETLALDFNREWHDAGVRMSCGQSGRLYCLFDRALEVATCDPLDVRDRHIEEYLPTGADAPRIRQLMSEIEMWLFTHALNSRRTALGALPISALWLWGGGVPLDALPKVQGWVAGEDVFFNAFSGGKSGGGVVITPEQPGSDEWHLPESRWLKPAVAQLRSGRISQLHLSAGNRCYSVTAWQVRRFWRRGKPWWEFFA
jgi:hypothetical protein